MKVLFIGGNGNISWYCTTLALEKGYEVWILNRAATHLTRRAPPLGVREIKVDIRDKNAAAKTLRGYEFDVVADFICYNEEQAKTGIGLFQGKTRQYIFISSEAVYQRRLEYLPFKEDTPQFAPDSACSYVDGKVKAEIHFLQAYKDTGFPVAIIRPGYTYDTIIPVSLGHNCFTAPMRVLDGKPFLIAGDGKTLWPFTHSSDFARALVPLLGDERTIGDAVHIIGDIVHSWNEAMKTLADVLGVKKPKYLYISKEDVFKSEFGEQREVIAERMFDAVFDNSKIKSLVPGWSSRISLEEGLKQAVKWLYEDERRIRIVPQINMALEKLEVAYEQKLSRL
jgi:nucleoside-diphosphate-sugar epimerase